MLIPVQRLVRKVRQPASRKVEVRQLRRQLAGAGRERPGTEERAVAARLRQLREEIARATGSVRACASCAEGRPAPIGVFDGGHCCSGATGDVFTPDEVSALAAAGTGPRDLHSPDGEHAGCAFRGGGGCTLAVVDRPNVCLRYACSGLARELFESGRLGELQKFLDEMDQAFARYRELRSERLLDREWAELTGL